MGCMRENIIILSIIYKHQLFLYISSFNKLMVFSSYGFIEIHQQVQIIFIKHFDMITINGKSVEYELVVYNVVTIDCAKSYLIFNAYVQSAGLSKLLIDIRKTQAGSSTIFQLWFDLGEGENQIWMSLKKDLSVHNLMVDQKRSEEIKPTSKYDELKGKIDKANFQDQKYLQRLNINVYLFIKSLKAEMNQQQIENALSSLINPLQVSKAELFLKISNRLDLLIAISDSQNNLFVDLIKNHFQSIIWDDFTPIGKDFVLQEYQLQPFLSQFKNRCDYDWNKSNLFPRIKQQQINSDKYAPQKQNKYQTESGQSYSNMLRTLQTLKKCLYVRDLQCLILIKDGVYRKLSGILKDISQFILPELQKTIEDIIIIICQSCSDKYKNLQKCLEESLINRICPQLVKLFIQLKRELNLLPNFSKPEPQASSKIFTSLQQKRLQMSKSILNKLLYQCYKHSCDQNDNQYRYLHYYVQLQLQGPILNKVIQFQIRFNQCNDKDVFNIITMNLKIPESNESKFSIYRTIESTKSFDDFYKDTHIFNQNWSSIPKFIIKTASSIHTEQDKIGQFICQMLNSKLDRVLTGVVLSDFDIRYHGIMAVGCHIDEQLEKACFATIKNIVKHISPPLTVKYPRTEINQANKSDEEYRIVVSIKNVRHQDSEKGNSQDKCLQISIKQSKSNNKLWQKLKGQNKGVENKVYYTYTNIN